MRSSRLAVPVALALLALPLVSPVGVSGHHFWDHRVVVAEWKGDGAYAASIKVDEPSDCYWYLYVERNLRYRGMVGVIRDSNVSSGVLGQHRDDFDEGRPVAGAWAPGESYTVPPRLDLFWSSPQGGGGYTSRLHPGMHILVGGVEFNENKPYFVGEVQLILTCNKPFTVLDGTTATYERWDPFEFSGGVGAWTYVPLVPYAFVAHDVRATAEIATEGIFEFEAWTTVSGDYVVSIDGPDGHWERRLSFETQPGATFYAYVDEPSEWTMSVSGYSTSARFGAYSLQWPKGALPVST